MNAFKLECCHIYFLIFTPHLKYKGNGLVHDRVK